VLRGDEYERLHGAAGTESFAGADRAHCRARWVLADVTALGAGSTQVGGACRIVRMGVTWSQVGQYFEARVDVSVPLVLDSREMHL